MDMSVDQQIESIELSKKAADNMIKKGEALIRLSNNKDFKTVIKQGYFEDEASRLVLLKAAPMIRGSEHEPKIAKDIDAIGSLYQYFLAIQQQAEEARKAVEDADEALEELNSQE